jgi:hypothetical protein
VEVQWEAERVGKRGDRKGVRRDGCGHARGEREIGGISNL